MLSKISRQTDSNLNRSSNHVMDNKLILAQWRRQGGTEGMSPFETQKICKG